MFELNLGGVWHLTIIFLCFYWPFLVDGLKSIGLNCFIIIKKKCLNLTVLLKTTPGERLARIRWWELFRRRMSQSVISKESHSQSFGWAIMLMGHRRCLSMKMMFHNKRCLTTWNFWSQKMVKRFQLRICLKLIQRSILVSYTSQS